MLKEVEVHQVVGSDQTSLKKNLRRKEKIEEKNVSVLDLFVRVG